MGDSTDKTKKPSFWAGVKSEFKKIVWPDAKTTYKQSVAVVSISVVLGIIIAVLDMVAKYGVDQLIAFK